MWLTYVCCHYRMSAAAFSYILEAAFCISECGIAATLLSSNSSKNERLTRCNTYVRITNTVLSERSVIATQPYSNWYLWP